MAPPSPGHDIRQRRGAAHSEERSVFPPYAFLIDNSSNFITGHLRTPLFAPQGECREAAGEPHFQTSKTDTGMEKKQLISVVKPLIAAALLFGSSGGVAWGQVYIGTATNSSSTSGATQGGQIGFEAAANNNRNNAAINGANGVNNQFGAGESATILGRPSPPLQWGIPDITFPGTTRPVAPRYIHIGSTEASGKNIVINSYNGGGDIQGWINQVIQAGNCPASTGWVLSPPSWPVCTITYSNVAGKTGLFHPSSLQNGWKVNAYSWGHTHGSGGCAVSVGGGPWYFSKWGTFAPYTTNQNTVDDGVNLVQTIGQAVLSDPTWNNRGVARTANLSGTTTDLELYRRPTTVAISPGYSYFTEFKIEDVEWWYNTYNVYKYDFSA